MTLYSPPGFAFISKGTAGPVVGFLLDARIRRLTEDRKSFDDVMRLACKQYGAAHGFTPEQFQATASEVAGSDLRPLFHSALDTTEELDDREALDWFGLQLTDDWALGVRPDASDVQARHLERLAGVR